MICRDIVSIPKLGALLCASTRRAELLPNHNRPAWTNAKRHRQANDPVALITLATFYWQWLFHTLPQRLVGIDSASLFSLSTLPTIRPQTTSRKLCRALLHTLQQLLFLTEPAQLHDMSRIHRKCDTVSHPLQSKTMPSGTHPRSALSLRFRTASVPHKTIRIQNQAPSCSPLFRQGRVRPGKSARS